MSDDRGERIADLSQAAQDRATDDRSSFVRQAAADDSGRRRDVESLLAEDDVSGALQELIGDAARSLLADNAAVQLDSFIGPYRIESLLGVGGMGEVYRARSIATSRSKSCRMRSSRMSIDWHASSARRSSSHPSIIRASPRFTA